MTVLVYLRHVRQIIRPNGKQLCSRGLRGFAERHGLNYDDFARNGIDAEVLEAIDNPFAKKAAKIARAEAEKSGQ